MKINRYMYGSRNEGLLKEQRSRMRSPEQVAAEAYAPYGAVADVADTVGGVLEAENQKRMKVKAESAAVSAQTQTSFMSAAMENLPKEAAANNWTPEQMAEAGAAALKTYNDSLKSVDPEFQDQLRPSWNMNKAMYAQQIADMTLAYEDKQNREKMNASWIAAIEGKDPISMKMVMDMSADMNYADAEQLAKMRSQIEVITKENAIEEIYDNWQQSDNPDAAYSRLVNDDSLDKDIKDEAIKQIEQQINNEKSLDTKRTQLAAIAFERQVTDLTIRAKNGEDITAEIEPLIAEMDSFNSPTLSDKASGWRNTLYLATVKGLKKGVDNTLIARNLANGPGTMVGDKSNRTALQGYANEISAGATPEQRDIIENNLTKAAGFPTERIHQELKAAGAGYNAMPLIRAATRMLEITDGDPYTGIDLDLTNEEMANLTKVVTAMTSGLDVTEVAEEVVENNKAWRDNRMVTSELQKQSANIETQDSFEELFDNAYDDLPWWGGQAQYTTAEETAARIRYENLFQQAYIRNGGDEEAAKLAANMRFQQTHAMTYINGEPELQYGGIRAGSEELGDTLWENDLKGMTVIGLDETDSFVMTLENRDDVKFRNPKIVDGKQHYQVYVNERPAFTMDNETRKSIFVVVDEETELKLQDAKDAEQIKEIQDKIDDLEKELNTAERMQSNIYQKGKSKERLKDIPKEIQLLQSQIRSLR